MPDQNASQAQILIVDDEAPLMNALCNMLRDRGYHTTGFTSPTRALPAIQETRFDVVFADLMMPEMDGIAFLRKALEIDSDIVGIIITGAEKIRPASPDREKIGRNTSAKMTVAYTTEPRTSVDA